MRVDPGLVGEADLEAGEVDLGLLAGRRLEADLERLAPSRAECRAHVRFTAVVATADSRARGARATAGPPVRSGKAASRSRR